MHWLLLPSLHEMHLQNVVENRGGHSDGDGEDDDEEEVDEVRWDRNRNRNRNQNDVIMSKENELLINHLNQVQEG